MTFYSGDKKKIPTKMRLPQIVQYDITGENLLPSIFILYSQLGVDPEQIILFCSLHLDLKLLI